MNRMATKESKITERELRHAELSGRIAAAGMVLLKNENHLLPFKNVQRIALFGNGARRTIKGGTGSGDVNTRSTVSVEEGLREAGYHIVTEQWLKTQDRFMTEAKKNYDANIRRLSKEGIGAALLTMMGKPFREPEYTPLTPEDCVEADAAVYVLARNSGEGADRRLEKGDYFFSDIEIGDLTLLTEQYKKVVLLLNVGGIMELAPVLALPGVDAILLMGQGGNYGGKAAAQILSGKVSPSGKLTATWARKYEEYPYAMEYAYLGGNIKDSFYKEEIFVGYRHFNTKGIPAEFPFGYGLSYANFDFKGFVIEKTEDSVRVVGRVKNTDKVYAGCEVMQVYVSVPAKKAEQPFQSLVGFTKTKLLAPGEEQVIYIDIPWAQIAWYSEERNCRYLGAGEYIFRIGNSSENTYIVGRISLSEENFFREKVQTKGKENNKNWLKERTDEELILLCVGGARVNMSDFSIIGNASKNIPGAAGETTGFLDYLGIPQCTMADGPAGVRVNPKVYESEKGYINNIAEDPILGLVLPEELQKTDLSGTTVKYQYCTALPIATMLAQTWDMELLYQAGDMVGAELEELGIHLWLAPGMNIHRNPLCGRNFEYFSEDPYLTGWCGTAITKGVQSHAGRGVTIKHIAANNQETNRNRNNSVVSERALRDIYLRGFEICIKEAKPYAAMTGVNLINGIHAANHKHILTEIMREEWDFDGVVMTDWGATGEFVEGDAEDSYGCSGSAECIKAGNDLIMPGTQGDVDRLKAAVECGKLSREELEVCAGRILRLLERTVGDINI